MGRCAAEVSDTSRSDTAPGRPLDYVVSAWLGLFVGQALIWYRFGTRLRSVFEGSSTVTAYSWRFLPLRANYLNARGIRPRYLGLSSGHDDPADVPG